MTTLVQIAPPQPRIVDTDNAGQIRVFPLRLGDISALLARHPALIAAFSGGGNAQLIVAAVLHSGQAAADDVVAAATRRAPDAEAPELTAFDEAEILVACIDATLPKQQARMGKFLADLGALMGRLGLNDAPEATE
jgi:hypothetical protein